jgi:hypothetical protein
VKQSQQNIANHYHYDYDYYYFYLLTVWQRMGQQPPRVAGLLTVHFTAAQSQLQWYYHATVPDHAALTSDVCFSSAAWLNSDYVTIITRLD